MSPKGGYSGGAPLGGCKGRVQWGGGPSGESKGKIRGGGPLKVSP